MPPPVALLLEGGERLTSSALSSLGWYRLDARKVGGRPVWRHAVHSDRWLAFDGEAWLCQTTDCLGQARGMLQLPDPKCLSPDQSLMPWKSPKEYSSTGWTVQPSLTCVAKTDAELAAAMRPPVALLLSCSRDLPLDVAVDCLGWYRLSLKPLGEWTELPADAREKHPNLAASPVWTHVVHEDRWISCSDSGWWAQEKRNLGTSVGWLQLPCLSSPAPPASFQQWKMWDGKAWLTQPLIECKAKTEAQLKRALAPHPALLLDCTETLSSQAASDLGWYRLTDRRVSGRPVWRHAVHSDRWLAFDGARWLCQLTDCLGQSKGMLQLIDGSCVSPDASRQIWKAWDGKRWDDQPALRCTAHTEAALEVARTPPPALLLECSKTLGLDSTAACLGWYRLTPDPRPKEERGSGSGGASSAGPATSSDTETSEGSSSSGNSNGDVARPFWVHTVHEDRWIGFADASWWCQGKANLGDAKGWLHLPCVSCFTPPGSRQAWRVWDGKAWTAQPLVRCHARTAAELAAALTPPLALLIEGGRRLHPGASACLGWYNLVSENPGDGSSSVARRINRRPIWKHATHPDRYIAFDGVAWLAQEKVNLGRADGWLELFDAGCISPDLSAQVWNASDGKDGWPAQPTITCRRPTEAEVAAEAVAASLLAEEEAASARNARKKAAKKAKKGAKKSAAAAAAEAEAESAEVAAAAAAAAAARGARAGAKGDGASGAHGVAAAGGGQGAAADDGPTVDRPARAPAAAASPVVYGNDGDSPTQGLPKVAATGMRVVLHSLVGRPELNGRHGLVLSYDSIKMRAGVKVEGEERPLALKIGNLTPAPADANQGGAHLEDGATRAASDHCEGADRNAADATKPGAHAAYIDAAAQNGAQNGTGTVRTPPPPPPPRELARASDDDQSASDSEDEAEKEQAAERAAAAEREAAERAASERAALEAQIEAEKAARREAAEQARKAAAEAAEAAKAEAKSRAAAQAKAAARRAEADRVQKEEARLKAEKRARREAAEEARKAAARAKAEEKVRAEVEAAAEAARLRAAEERKEAEAAAKRKAEASRAEAAIRREANAVAARREAEAATARRNATAAAEVATREAEATATARREADAATTRREAPQSRTLPLRDPPPPAPVADGKSSDRVLTASAVEAELVAEAAARSSRAAAARAAVERETDEDALELFGLVEMARLELEEECRAEEAGGGTPAIGRVAAAAAPFVPDAAFAQEAFAPDYGPSDFAPAECTSEYCGDYAPHFQGSASVSSEYVPPEFAAGFLPRDYGGDYVGEFTPDFGADFGADAPPLAHLGSRVLSSRPPTGALPPPAVLRGASWGPAGSTATVSPPRPANRQYSGPLTGSPARAQQGPPPPPPHGPPPQLMHGQPHHLAMSHAPSHAPLSRAVPPRPPRPGPNRTLADGASAAIDDATAGGLVAKAARIRTALGLAEAPIPAILERAGATIGMRPAGGLVQQADALSWAIFGE